MVIILLSALVLHTILIFLVVLAMSVSSCFASSCSHCARHLTAFLSTLRRTFLRVRFALSTFLTRETILTLASQALCFILIEKLLYQSTKRFGWLYLVLIYRVMSNYVFIMKSLRQGVVMSNRAAMNHLHWIFGVVSKVACMAAIMSTIVIFSTTPRPMTFLTPTLTYFIITDPYYIEYYAEKLRYSHWNCLEGLEELVCLAVCKSVAIVLSTYLIVLTLISRPSSSSPQNVLILSATFFTNVYVPCRQLLLSLFRDIWEEARKLRYFEKAKFLQLQRYADVCAICLANMKHGAARITPCGHIFHGKCLLLAIRQCSKCPMCNKIFDI